MWHKLWKHQNPQSTEKCTQPIFRNYDFKRAVRTSITFWCSACFQIQQPGRRPFWVWRCSCPSSAQVKRVREVDFVFGVVVWVIHRAFASVTGILFVTKSQDHNTSYRMGNGHNRQYEEMNVGNKSINLEMSIDGTFSHLPSLCWLMDVKFVFPAACLLTIWTEHMSHLRI